MKNHIFTYLMNKFFILELNSYIKKYQQQESYKKLKTNYPLGTDVFLKSNEADPLIIGTVISYEKGKNQLFLVVLKHETKKETITWDQNPHYYSEEKYEILKKLSWDEQYNVLYNSYYAITAEAKIEKEIYHQ